MDERIFDIVEKVEMIAVGVDGRGNAIAQFDQDANLEEAEEEEEEEAEEEGISRCYENFGDTHHRREGSEEKGE